MRARVVRTGAGDCQLLYTACAGLKKKKKKKSLSARTLSDINIGARKAICGEKAGVHVDAMLYALLASEMLTTLLPTPSASVCMHTESSTLLRALSSASILSFLRCSSAKVRWAVPPLVARPVVGPEGTVGAWRLLILSGRPITVWSVSSELGDHALNVERESQSNDCRRAFSLLSCLANQSTAITRC